MKQKPCRTRWVWVDYVDVFESDPDNTELYAVFGLQECWIKKADARDVFWKDTNKFQVKKDGNIIGTFTTERRGGKTEPVHTVINTLDGMLFDDIQDAVRHLIIKRLGGN